MVHKRYSHQAMKAVHIVFQIDGFQGCVFQPRRSASADVGGVNSLSANRTISIG